MPLFRRLFNKSICGTVREIATEASVKKDPEKCPDCETGTLRLERYSDEFNYRGQLLTVEGLQCWVCDSCAADIIRPEQIRHGDKLFADARRRADRTRDGWGSQSTK